MSAPTTPVKSGPKLKTVSMHTKINAWYHNAELESLFVMQKKYQEW